MTKKSAQFAQKQTFWNKSKRKQTNGLCIICELHSAKMPKNVEIPGFSPITGLFSVDNHVESVDFSTHKARAYSGGNCEFPKCPKIHYGLLRKLQFEKTG